MKNLSALVVSLAVAACCSVASCFAETVGWWRFADLGKEGGLVSSETVFTNAVDAMHYPAHPCSFSGYEAPGTEEGWLPTVTNAIAGSSSIHVLSSRAGAELSAALFLHCRDFETVGNRSSGAYVDAAPELIGCGAGGTGDFTFECVFRTTEAGVAEGRNLCLGEQKSDGDFGAWFLSIRSGKLWGGCTVTNAVGVRKDSRPTSDGVITPGVWHHVAVTFKSATGECLTYLDYVQTHYKGTPDGEGPWFIAPAGGSRICFGKSFHGDRNRGFEGDLGEIRISNACLGPDDFLRFREGRIGDRECGDADCRLWCSLDNPGAFESFFAECPNLDQYGTHYLTCIESAADGTISYSSGATPSIRENLSGSAMKNVGSMVLSGAGDRYLELNDPRHEIAASDFTQEFFFRAARPIKNSDANFGIAGAGFFKMWISKSDGNLYCRLWDRAGGEHTCSSYPVRSADDQCWHHVALTYDAELPRVRLYLDRELIGTVDTQLRTNSTQRHTFGISLPDGAQYFEGQLDEIRLVGRTLEPEEFLTLGRGIEGARLWIPLDGETLAEPYGLFASANVFCPDSSIPSPVDASWPVLRWSSEGRRVQNPAALAFRGGLLSYPGIDALTGTVFTVECFFRPYEKAAPYPSVLGVSKKWGGAISTENGDARWGFAYKGTWEYAQLEFFFRTIDSADKVFCSKLNVAPRYPYDDKSHSGDSPGYGLVSFDGRWHHMAAIVESLEDGTKTRVTTYWDYKEVESVTVDGRLLSEDARYLVLGRGNSSDRLATWDLDAVRVSDGVLSPVDFLRKQPNGLIVLVK